MMRSHTMLPSLCAVLLFTAACSSDSKDTKTGNQTGPDGGDEVDAGDQVIVKDSDCDKTQRPFVFVHGTYGSGDNFANVATLLGSNGFCAERIVAVEYDSLGEQPGVDCDSADPAPPGCGKIDDVIDKVLADNPDFDQVDLAGHSQGTAHCKTYLGDAARAAKVAHYINFSGVGAVPNDVETLSLSSEHDLGNKANHATGTHVQTVTFHDQDHFAVAASRDSFVEVYKYLTGNDPKYTEVQLGEDPVTIEGMSESFADNAPAGGRIEIRAVGSTSRSDAAPEKTVTPDEKGHFGPFTLKRGVPYEFRGFDDDGNPIGSQYFAPFKRSNRLVRLLIPASATDGAPIMVGGQPVGAVVAKASTDNIVRGPNHTAVVVRWAGGACRQDLGARLTVDGTEVLTDVTAGAAALANSATAGGVVGFFMYDSNDNQTTDLGMVTSGPFLMFTDVYMNAQKSGFITLKFKAGSEDETVDQTLKIDNWPSSDGTVLAFFQ